ncbi:uncharacterized protein EI90DRAFT_3047576 [Cantharellus anzutake]|uniref:uncharacterized protein n=1 Tax=Cantharellus anzutake TaxID=1750568 RepID=UPI001904526F|nr:uncharacterized protein EI90DRAFT_3047576 [Cantharellus anzutake]KAF8335928.1 hypothetical protein EI90DRAFT_3047576 [Cantharellus anzutake]
MAFNPMSTWELVEELAAIDDRNLNGRITRISQLPKGSGDYGDVYLGMYKGERICVKFLKTIEPSNSVSAEPACAKYPRRLKREEDISVRCEGRDITRYLKNHPEADRRFFGGSGCLRRASIPSCREHCSP